jgi:hypothetical protein
MSDIAPKGTLHLYELTNRGRRETLIALLADGREAALTRVSNPRPPAIAHWGPGDAFDFEQIAAAMPVADAEEFVQLYVEKVRSNDWKTLVWRG